MPELTPAQIRLRDPLSEVTRNERRFLLGISIIAIALVRTGLVPSKISALGIEFSQADQKSLLSILALITLYFLAAFILYASNDLVAWRIAYLQAVQQWASEREAALDEQDFGRKREEVIHQMLAVDFRYSLRLGDPVSFLRAVFEFLLPVVVGVYATLLLWKAPPPLQQEHRDAPAIVVPHETTSIDSDAPIHLFP